MKLFVYIEPFVLTNKVDNLIIYYNTLNSDYSIFDLNEVNHTLLPDCHERTKIVNEFEFSEVKPIYQELRDKFMLDFIENEGIIKKPYIVSPKITFGNGVDLSQFKKGLNTNIAMTQVYELDLYITNECNLHCPECDFAFKQFKHCFKNKNSSILPFNKIREIIGLFGSYSLMNINILGGNILLHPSIKKIANYLSETKYNVNFFLTLNQVSDLKGLEWSKYINIHFFVTKHNVHLLSKVTIDNTGGNLVFVVSSEEDIELFDSKVKELCISKYTVFPLFDGKNLSFFKKYVFIEKADLVSSKKTVVEILTNKLINRNFYGKLILNSDGDILESINSTPRGNINQIKTSYLPELLRNNFGSFDSWFETKQNVKGCNSCIYNFLCTPTTNYEKHLGLNKFCNI